MSSSLSLSSRHHTFCIVNVAVAGWWGEGTSGTDHRESSDANSDNEQSDGLGESRRGDSTSSNPIECLCERRARVSGSCLYPLCVSYYGCTPALYAAGPHDLSATYLWRDVFCHWLPNTYKQYMRLGNEVNE